MRRINQGCTQHDRAGGGVLIPPLLRITLTGSQLNASSTDRRDPGSRDRCLKRSSEREADNKD